MFNFFVNENNKQDNIFFIVGSDLNHLKNVIRLKEGDEIFVSYKGSSHLCEITNINETEATAKIKKENAQNSELPCEIILFQGLPKGDKTEFIIQKAVELGVSEIIPTEMARCVVKLDSKKKKAKRERWQAIAESAAKQSKRSLIPKVSDVLSYNEAMEKAKSLSLFIVPYENKEGMKSTLSALKEIKKGDKIGILIGPEGGFEEKEIEKAILYGGKTISLGKRILRTETAAITAAAMCMLYIESTLEEEENA